MFHFEYYLPPGKFVISLFHILIHGHWLFFPVFVLRLSPPFLFDPLSHKYIDLGLVELCKPYYSKGAWAV